MPDWMTSLVNGIERWQTLITGLIAVGVAYWTIRPLKEQISLQKSQMEDDKLRRKESEQRRTLAVRAAMTEALSQLSVYAKESAGALNTDTGAPPVPSEAVRVLHSAIEFIDAEASSAVFELVSFVQVHNARLSGHIARGGARNLEDRLYDTAKLYALTDRLYPYARNEGGLEDMESLSRKAMISALRGVIGLANYVRNADSYVAVVELINRRHPASEDSEGL